MRYGKGFICVFSAALMIFLLGVLRICTVTVHQVSLKPDIILSFSFSTGEGSEEIRCIESQEEKYYVFLPGHVQMDALSVSAVSGEIEIGHILVEENMKCSGYELGRSYPLVCREGGQVLESTIEFVQTGNIPSLYIDVQSGSMDYIHRDKTNEEPGTIRLYGASGREHYAGSLTSMKGRGNSSWGAQKKPYNLELSEDTDLLGMGAARNWILLAEGYNSLNIRNKIVYDFAAEAGLDYSPNCAWINLYLNGEYAGLYLLSERNELHSERVAISKENSFLVSMENQSSLEAQKLPCITVEDAQAFRVRYASMTDQEITQIWAELYHALQAADGRNPSTGRHWQELIDLDSWARKYLIEEVFGNADGGILSQYFYYDASETGGAIHAGPVWDYDYSMGGEDFWLKSTPTFLVLAREYADSGARLPWYFELYQKEEFYSRLTELYETVFLPLLSELLESGLDAYYSHIQDAAFCDGIRWGYSREAVDSDFRLVKSFLESRVAFLTDLWVNGSQYHTVQVEPGRYGTGYLAVKDGSVLPKLPDVQEMGGLGWYNAATDTPFDITQPIYESVHIYVKKPDSSLSLIHYVPVAAAIAVLPLLLIWDGYRVKKNRRVRNDPVKADEISS